MVIETFYLKLLSLDQTELAQRPWLISLGKLQTYCTSDVMTELDDAAVLSMG